MQKHTAKENNSAHTRAHTIEASHTKQINMPAFSCSLQDVSSP